MELVTRMSPECCPMRTDVGQEPTQGKNPRSFGIDPPGTFLIVANQSSSNLAPFRMKPKTGSLKAIGGVVEVPTPMYVKIINPG
jgi:6-phosphogluconolactonase